jgi:hypothetical protein
MRRNVPRMTKMAAPRAIPTAAPLFFSIQLETFFFASQSFVQMQ